MGIASTIYGGSASYGRFIAIVGAIIATIIAIFLIGGGIKFNTSVSNYSSTSSATITGKNCTNQGQGQGQGQGQKECIYTLKYIDTDGILIENVILKSQLDMQINSTITISYNPSNKTDIRLTSENTKETGYVMIGIAIIILLFAWGWVWVTRKYEFAASASGFSSAFNMFKN